MSVGMVVVGAMLVLGALGFVTWDIRSGGHQSPAFAVPLVLVALSGGLWLVVAGLGLLVLRA
jgi:hypothetical protein